MNKKEIFKLITDQYIKNIDNLTEEYTNTFHQLFREGDFVDEEVKGVFGKLAEKAGRYGSYLEDENNCLFHEEDIYLEAKKTKENYDKYK